MKVIKDRNILAVSTAENDAVHKWKRTGTQLSVNNRTRNIFCKAVIDMFGGVSKVPDSVKEAMLLEDYDSGKPLTARRILIVKRAIDACGILRQRAEEQRLVTFDRPENKAEMLAKGYSTMELPRLARANIRTVGDKAEALCGAVHREQASSVLMLLSQSGLGNLLGGLKGHGITSTEHSAVDYKLTKNERTGAITIHYSSPEELPFKFKWTAKVDVYGNVSSTPMKFEMPVENQGTAAAK